MGYSDSQLMIHCNNESPQYSASEVESAVGTRTRTKTVQFKTRTSVMNHYMYCVHPVTSTTPQQQPMNGHTNENQALAPVPTSAVPQREAVTTTIILYPTTNNVENTDPIPAVREDHGMEPRRTGASVTTTIILYATPTHRNSGTE